MPSALGPAELLYLLPIILVTFLVPLATLLLVFLTYRRLDRLEEHIKQVPPPQW